MHFIHTTTHILTSLSIYVKLYCLSKCVLCLSFTIVDRWKIMNLIRFISSSRFYGINLLSMLSVHMRRAVCPNTSFMLVHSVFYHRCLEKRPNARKETKSQKKAGLEGGAKKNLVGTTLLSSDTTVETLKKHWKYPSIGQQLTEFHNLST